MGQAVEAAAAFDHVLECEQFGQVQRRRFFTEHMKTRAQRLAGDRRVQVVGRDDHQQLHALLSGQRTLGLEHLLPVAVAARGRQAQCCASVPIVLCIATERAAHQFKTAIEAGGLAVGLSYECALAAPDKAQSYFWYCSVHRNVLCWKRLFKLESRL
ncbi:hypothetical protein D3C73_947720 [compost metagenome]